MFNDGISNPNTHDNCLSIIKVTLIIFLRPITILTYNLDLARTLGLGLITITNFIHHNSLHTKSRPGRRRWHL